jgi:hypothetical protein
MRKGNGAKVLPGGGAVDRNTFAATGEFAKEHNPGMLSVW